MGVLIYFHRHSGCNKRDTKKCARCTAGIILGGGDIIFWKLRGRLKINPCFWAKNSISAQFPVTNELGITGQQFACGCADTNREQKDRRDAGCFHAFFLLAWCSAAG